MKKGLVILVMLFSVLLASCSHMNSNDTDYSNNNYSTTGGSQGDLPSLP